MISTVIKLENSCDQYGPFAPVTQALLDTVMETNLTPQDWKTIYKITLSGGHYLLWSAEWCEANKRMAMMNVQAGNVPWDINMLL